MYVYLRAEFGSLKKDLQHYEFAWTTGSKAEALTTFPYSIIKVIF